jgi:hypothetical protein
LFLNHKKCYSCFFPCLVHYQHHCIRVSIHAWQIVLLTKLKKCSNGFLHILSIINVITYVYPFMHNNSFLLPMLFLLVCIMTLVTHIMWNYFLLWWKLECHNFSYNHNMSFTHGVIFKKIELIIYLSIFQIEIRFNSALLIFDRETKV